MNLVSFTLPDDPAAVAGWLERRLVGPDLPDLVGELIAIHGPGPAGATLDSVLGERLDAVLADGLDGLPAETVRALLRHPRLLPELQEAVLAAGSPYWDELLTALEVADPSVAVRRRLRVALGSEPTGPRPKPGRRGWWLPLAALAAAVVIGVALYRPPAAGAPEWGWNKPDVLTRGETASAHLTALADAADEWFARPRSSSDELARALADMRRGCSRLILAEHTPLSPEQRKTLKEKCQKWATALDDELRELERDGNADAVRPKADETVRKLAAALREMAGQRAG